MSPNRKNDTIAAICTPPGEGGVAIVRLSGQQAKAIGSAMFQSPRPSFAAFKPHTLHFGKVVAKDATVLDEGLCVFMPGPRSYTGEDTIEFHVHGGHAAPRGVLEEALSQGARMADKGEFTLRAFLNGRMDLTQAEAVAELIHAPSKAALHMAQAKLSGVLGGRITSLRTSLESLRQQLCMAVDFPEDEVECLAPDELITKLDAGISVLDDLLAGVERARAWREGAMAVLCGRVNAGKSSLLNALLGRQRAIVTDVPGTTRDYLEEGIDLDGLTVRIVDTAGLRTTEDDIEAAGMEMSREIAQRADLVVFVADGSRPIAKDELNAAASFGTDRTLIAINKADLEQAEPDPGETFEEHWFTTVRVSAKSGQGLEELGQAIRQSVLAGQGEPDPDEAVPNLRQAEILRKARAELLSMRQDASEGIPPDLLGVALETATTQLASLTGEITPSEVLNSIFDSFCIGK